LALSLFEERDAPRAEAAARELSARNAERQVLERRVVAEARQRIGSTPGETLLVEADPGWHRGVLGIAASRLAREYHRPVLLFGMDGDRASGSGRSIPGVSLHGILKELATRFTDFGGHEQAVGGSLPASGFEAFRSEARALFRDRVPPDTLVPRAEADGELPLDAVSEELVRELARLEPHGSGNPKPVFLARGVESAGAFTPIGESGLRGRLRTARGGIRAIAWQPAADVAGLLASGRQIDVQYRVGGDRRGYGLQAEILRARVTETAA